ncbi:MAG TPA: RimK/LysX family protein [Candidatus Saccharimonadales bacterium]|nr:RimK/LysX family protein [Candidatus Saccharimonadales bacterium]
MSSKLTIIGREAEVTLPLVGVKGVKSKTDTGADLSSIWCGEIKKVKDRLECIFFGPGSPYYTGKKIIFNKAEYKKSKIFNSFGAGEKRYKVKMPIVVNGRRIRTTFTLADRSKKEYPILIGRKLLAKKFLVDVAGGLSMKDGANTVGDNV